MRNLIILAVIVGFGLMIWKLLEAQKQEASADYDSQANLLRRLPNSVQHSISTMAPQQYALFLSDYKPRRKKTSVAYLTWFLCGLHYAYARQWLLQFFFWFTGGGFGIWWFIDLFRMPGIVRDVNGDVARQVLSDMSVAQGFAANAAAAPMLGVQPPLPRVAPSPVALPAAADAPVPTYDEHRGAWVVVDAAGQTLVHDEATDQWLPAPPHA
jgi:hypothetical protein